MIKYFCDRCGKEITGNAGVTADSACLCEECMENELTYGFKVGDEVIISTGKVGKIIDICTCNQCKERGFYEPVVEVEIGNGSIWITDNDKRVGFKSFYKIGDQVFGNLDEDGVLQDISTTKREIRELQEELIQYNAQLNIVKKMKQFDKTK